MEGETSVRDRLTVEVRIKYRMGLGKGVRIYSGKWIVLSLKKVFKVDCSIKTKLKQQSSPRLIKPENIIAATMTPSTFLPQRQDFPSFFDFAD